MPLLYEPGHSVSCKVECVPIRRLRSTCADAPADMCVCWAHMHSCIKYCGPAHMVFFLILVLLCETRVALSLQGRNQKITMLLF